MPDVGPGGGRHHKIPGGVALLVADADSEVFRDLPLQSDIPRGAARVLQPAGNLIQIEGRTKDLAAGTKK